MRHGNTELPFWVRQKNRLKKLFLKLSRAVNQMEMEDEDEFVEEKKSGNNDEEVEEEEKETEREEDDN